MQVGSVQSPLNSGLSVLRPSAKAAARIYTDPRDTNQDGVVSPAEAQAYTQRHPSLNQLATPSAAQNHSGANHLSTFADYTLKGIRNQVPKAVPSLLDLKA